MTDFKAMHDMIDEAQNAVRQRGIGRQMITHAHGILLRINKTDKSIPAWLNKELSALKEALTYENYEDC